MYNVLLFYHPARASVFLSFVWVTRARNSLLFSSCPFSFFRTICLFTQNSTKKMTYMYVRFNEDISCPRFSKKEDINHTIWPKIVNFQLQHSLEYEAYAIIITFFYIKFNTNFYNFLISCHLVITHVLGLILIYNQNKTDRYHFFSSHFRI